MVEIERATQQWWRSIREQVSFIGCKSISAYRNECRYICSHVIFRALLWPIERWSQSIVCIHRCALHFRRDSRKQTLNLGRQLLSQLILKVSIFFMFSLISIHFMDTANYRCFLFLKGKQFVGDGSSCLKNLWYHIIRFKEVY